MSKKNDLARRKRQHEFELKSKLFFHLCTEFFCIYFIIYDIYLQVSTFLWGLIRRERREGKEGKEASCKEEQNESKYFRSNCFLQPLVE